MRSVTVRVQAEDLAREMIAMRGWLDRNRYEPTRFDCNQNEGRSPCRLTSGRMLLLKHFAQCFDGEGVHQLLHPKSSRRPTT
jgi:hypothetical protein